MNVLRSIYDIPPRFHASLVERLLAKTPEPGEGGCWPWTGPVGNSGYGVIGAGNRLSISTHKLSWLLFCGETPPGQCVLHRCDNRRCINPEHLFLGTHAENSRDMVAKGRHVSGPAKRTACPLGHPYDRINANGARTCSICMKAANLRHRQKRATQ